jgi:hypothetical protein
LASLPEFGNIKPVIPSGVISLRIYANFALGSEIVSPPYTYGNVLS